MFSTKQLLTEFSPLFDTIKEYNDIKMIIDFVIALNKLMDEMNSIFTMENFFGAALVEFYELNLLSDTYSQRYELLQLKISFEKVRLFSYNWYLVSGIEFNKFCCFKGPAIFVQSKIRKCS